VASVLVDICLSIIEEGGDRTLQRQYMQKIQDEAPNSGALEYIEAFTGFQRTGDVKKSRRLLRKSKKLAKAANDAALLQLIEGAEKILSPASPFDMMGKLFGMGGDQFNEDMFDDKMLEDLLKKMKGFM
jgi:hypothetical protein